MLLPRSCASIFVLSPAAVFALPPTTVFALPPATVVALPPAPVAALPPAAGSVLDSQRKGTSLTAVVLNCHHTLLPLPQSPPPAAIATAIATAIMANYIPPHQPQLRRPLGTFVGEKKHPSQGGNPYSQDVRDLVITCYQLGLPLVSPDLDELRQEYQYPSVWSCWRYIRQFIQEGRNSTRCRMGAGQLTGPIGVEANPHKGYWGASLTKQNNNKPQGKQKG